MPGNEEDDDIKGFLRQGGIRIKVTTMDMERAADFYRSTFGFQVKNSDGSIARAGPEDRGTIVLVVDDVRGSPARLRALPLRRIVSELIVDDFERLVQVFQEAGCEFDSRHTSVGIDGPSPYVQFVDPFGHRWSFQARSHSEPDSESGLGSRT